MSTPIARPSPGRRSWLEPCLWLGVPALLAIVPWSVRQWPRLQPASRADQGVTVRLTGEGRQDRLMLLEQAWSQARPQPIPPEVPTAVQDRIARREAAWLSEIARLLFPLDPRRAEQAAEEAMARIAEIPERMGPDDLALPEETPTGRLMGLARVFESRPEVARRVRQAALHEARVADWAGSRAYALCLIARECANADPPLARAALREARQVAAQLPTEERWGALAAIAGSGAALGSAGARPLAERVARALEGGSEGPEARALAAVLIAPAAPEAADRLAGEAVTLAAVATAPAGEYAPFRGPFGSGLLEERPPVGPTSFGFGPSTLRPRRAVDPASASDSQLRRVAASLATARPALAQRAAERIHGPHDRSGSLSEVAELLEERDPGRASALYRLALETADQIRRPMAARRAARIRAAAGLAPFDPATARAVVEPLPPRLVSLEMNEFAARLARSDPEDALALVERAERAVLTAESRGGTPFGSARAAIAAQVVAHDPRRAGELVANLRGRRTVDAWLALALALARSSGE